MAPFSVRKCPEGGSDLRAVCEGQRHPGEVLSLANGQMQPFQIAIGHLLSVELGPSRTGPRGTAQ